jgi:DNA-binding CsgD family transcriptional regulator
MLIIFAMSRTIKNHAVVRYIWFIWLIGLVSHVTWHYNSRIILSIVVCHENVTPLKLAEEMIRERERDLALKTRNLEEVNTALRMLVEQREKDKRELEEWVVSNVRQLVTRYIDKMKETHLNDHQRTLLGIIESHLKNVISPFLQKASALNIQLTPGEIQVAALVRTTKEIAGTLNISAHAVDFRRKNIRSKLGLNRKKIKSSLIPDIIGLMERTLNVGGRQQGQTKPTLCFNTEKKLFAILGHPYKTAISAEKYWMMPRGLLKDMLPYS